MNSDPRHPEYSYEVTNEIRDELKRSLLRDPVTVLEAITESWDEVDQEFLLTNTRAFGERLQTKVLDYLESIIETEYGK